MRATGYYPRASGIRHTYLGLRSGKGNVWYIWDTRLSKTTTNDTPERLFDCEKAELYFNLEGYEKPRQNDNY
jgi:hypothetical protein